MLGESDDILRPLAQRRNPQLKLAEAVKQILAEAALAYCGLEVLVGCGDNPDVNLDFAMPTQAVERLSIQHAQQLPLCLQLHFPDLIEEKCAFIGEFEQPRLGCIGAAKRALFVTEQFTLHQVFRKGGAIDVNPRTAAAVG